MTSRSSPNEVEIKFMVASIPELTKKLKAAGFRPVTKRTHEDNTLYDFPDGALRHRGEVLRLRKYGKKWKVTHKGKVAPGRHKSRPEAESEVRDVEQVRSVFQQLGLGPVFRYEKFRAEWADKHGHVVIDQTPIGDFGEIEGPPKWIDSTAKKLGIRRAQYITKSYAGLFQEWKHRTHSRADNMTWEETA